MQLTSEERLRFYQRVGLSASLFLLLCSLGANVFLIFSPWTMSPAELMPQPLPENLLLQPMAFGTVERGFTARTQERTGTSAVLAASAYNVPDNIFPDLPELIPLYRDQGVPLDAAHMETLLKKMNVTIPWESLQPLPLLEKWRSADRTMEFTLDLAGRSLTVVLLGSFGPDPEGRADDPTTISIATQFVRSLNVDMSAYGTPRIVEKIADNGSSRTYVVWPASVAGYPLIDTNAQPVPGAQIQVGRLSRRALSATFTLLSPESLAHSSYPRATTDQLKGGFNIGGVLRAPHDPQGPRVEFTAAQQVYVFMPPDREHPVYLVPGVYATWMQKSCADCAAVSVPTFLPALDPSQFEWYEEEAQQPNPLP